MPDANGLPLPGEDGYVAPIETPGAIGGDAPELTPLQELADAEKRLAEQENQPTVETTVEPDAVPEPPTQAQYMALLAAYKKLKVRVGIDPAYEKVLDAEAGL